MSNRNRSNRRSSEDQGNQYQIRLFLVMTAMQVVAKIDEQVVKTFSLKQGPQMVAQFLQEYGAWALAETRPISDEGLTKVLIELKRYTDRPAQRTNQVSISSNDAKELIATGNRILSMFEQLLLGYVANGRFGVRVQTDQSPATDITVINGLKPKAGFVQSPDGTVFWVTPIDREKLHNLAAKTGYTDRSHQQRPQHQAQPQA